MLQIGSIVLRVDDLERQTDFWEAALDWPPHADYVILGDPEGNRFCVVDIG